MSELTFDGQHEEESVKFIFRRHFITVRNGILFMLIVMLIGALPMFMWPDLGYMFWIFVGSIIVGLLGFGYSYIKWYFSIYIVTNERIRQINQKGLFKKSTIDLDLDKIQSVSVHVPGIFAGIFDYGTILIQTGVGDLVISMVPHPNKIHNKLQNAIKEAA